MKIIDIANNYLRSEKGEHEYIVVYVDNAKVVSCSKVFADSLESAVCKYEFAGKTILGAFQDSDDVRRAMGIADYVGFPDDDNRPIYDLRKLSWSRLTRQGAAVAKKPRHS